MSPFVPVGACHAAIEDLTLESRLHAASGDLQGLRHSRHRRARRSRPTIVRAVGQALGTLAPRASARHDRHRPRRPPVRTRAVRRAVRRHPRGRRERHRPRHGRHADDLLRRARTRHRLQHDGDRAATIRPTTTASRWSSTTPRCPATTSRQLRRRIERGELATRRRQLHARTTSRPPTSIASSPTSSLRARLRSPSMRATAWPAPTRPTLFRRLGCDVVEMYCDVDGTFPNHHPDPSQPKNLVDLIARVRKGDLELGLAFDGDGDRLGVVTRDGQLIFPDRQLMLFAADVLSRVPGATIIYDVKSTRNLRPWIERHGGMPLLWKTGHSLIKAKMKETGRRARRRDERPHVLRRALVRLRRRPVRGARLLEILSRARRSVGRAERAARCGLHARAQHRVRGRRAARADRASCSARRRSPAPTEVIRIDGLRVEYPDGFGLARASNTTPVVVLRFEADDDAALARIQGEFRRVLRQRASPERRCRSDRAMMFTLDDVLAARERIAAASTSRRASSRSRCRSSPARTSGASSTTCSAPAASRSAARAMRCCACRRSSGARGVVAASAGNHALGVAYHGSLLGIPVTVVMPKFAALIKVTNCRQLGATRRACTATTSPRRERAPCSSRKRRGSRSSTRSTTKT